MPSYDFDTDICLFDLDGTLVSTIEASELTWTDLCKKHGVDPQELFKHSHGARSAEMLARFFPQLDNSQNQMTIALEKQMADNYISTVKLIPGAKDLLLSLDKDTTNNKAKLHERKWAIVTSGTPYLAFSWFNNILKEVGKPDVFVTGLDVTKGKPDPMGYQMAKDKLADLWNLDLNGTSGVQSVVFEDAPIGIKAGKAIGAITIGITTSYPKELLFAAGADYVVDDLTHVTVVKNSETGKITLKVTNPLTK
ncbi:2-deoxyglucose-6-phosphate phosphatase 2 [Monosporozyma unispora]|nr:2-deoxyglucose-6-phosphatase [Kazachstania unispora]